MFRLASIVFAVIALVSVRPAHAITYFFAFGTPGASVVGSLETNGTLGQLDASDILDWTIEVVNGADTFVLLGDAQSGDNSDVFIDGGSLSATADELLYDFDGSGFVLFQAPRIGSGETWFCIQNSGCSGVIDDTFIANPLTVPDGILTGPTFRGTVSVAGPVVANVPAPASALCLIAGLGLLARSRASRLKIRRLTAS